MFCSVDPHSTPASPWPSFFVFSILVLDFLGLGLVLFLFVSSESIAQQWALLRAGPLFGFLDWSDNLRPEELQ